ncbi:MAG: sigma-54 dependent transcriptional regulator [Pseudohongiellaceae bacterium]
MKSKVLIVDDEPDIRELLEITLARMSLNTESASNLAEAKELLAAQAFDLCLTDMRLPDGDGIELVELIQSEYNEMPVAVITAHGSVETAIKSLKAGAFDFVSKPVDLQRLRDLINSALRLAQNDKMGGDGKSTLAPGMVYIKGNSKKIRHLREQIGKLARSQAPVYISGESGSGKELAARAIHAQSARCDAPFIAVNCGAIPGELVESELFGHLKGSFTGADQANPGLFQAAHGGTLFLDEVADLPLHIQVKLLRVIQEKAVRPVGAPKEIPIDVRILSATHKNLAVEVAAGRLRQDLFYRINVIELAVPPLRERIEDIPELTHHILDRIARENDSTSCAMHKDAETMLLDYEFPGNVRELENILQRASTLCENNLILPESLELGTGQPAPFKVDDTLAPEVEASVIADDDFSLERHLETIEIKAIEKALVETRWNKTAAAKKLGMSFRSLRYRLKKLGLE